MQARIDFSSNVHGRASYNAKSKGPPAPVQATEGNPVHLIRTVHEVRSRDLGQLSQSESLLHWARAARILSQYLKLIPMTLLELHFLVYKKVLAE